MTLHCSENNVSADVKELPVARRSITTHSVSHLHNLTLILLCCTKLISILRDQLQHVV